MICILLLDYPALTTVNDRDAILNRPRISACLQSANHRNAALQSPAAVMNRSATCRAMSG